MPRQKFWQVTLCTLTTLPLPLFAHTPARASFSHTLSRTISRTFLRNFLRRAKSLDLAMRNTASRARFRAPLRPLYQTPSRAHLRAIIPGALLSQDPL